MNACKVLAHICCSSVVRVDHTSTLASASPLLTTLTSPPLTLTALPRSHQSFLHSSVMSSISSLTSPPLTLTTLPRSHQLPTSAASPTRRVGAPRLFVEVMALFLHDYA